MANGDLIRYEIEIQGVNEQLKKLSGYDALADRHLAHAMNQSVVTLESAIKPLVPVFRGRLRGSIGSEVIREGVGSIVGKVGSNLKSEEYPVVMEFGRRPGAKMPPPSALERWVHLVMGVSETDAPGVAYTVARSIARRGIKGRRFMRTGFEKAQTRIKVFFQDAAQNIVKDLEVRG